MTGEHTQRGSVETVFAAVLSISGLGESCLGIDDQAGYGLV